MSLAAQLMGFSKAELVSSSAASCFGRIPDHPREFVLHVPTNVANVRVRTPTLNAKSVRTIRA